jgi:hypothetical protein
VKTFIFLMQLLTPDGYLPLQREPMPTMEACVARVDEMQKHFGAINENFTFLAGCVQASQKADPA